MRGPRATTRYSELVFRLPIDAHDPLPAHSQFQRTGLTLA
jgi:hypothetical protein